MDSKIVVSLLLILGLLGFVWYQNIEVSPTAKVKPSKLETAKQITKALLEEPRQSSIEKRPVRISVPCKMVWDQIQSMKVLDFKDLKFPNISACQNVPPEFSAITMKYLAACKNVLQGSVELSENEKMDCRAAFFTYRATITDFNTKGEDIDQISDLKILIDKLIASFGAGTNLNTDRILQAAERIHHLAPELYEPVKAIVVAKFGPIFKGERDPVRLADTYAQVEKAVQEAEEFNPADPDLWEAKFLARSRMAQDLDRGDQVIEEMRQVKGLEGLSDYFQAGIEFKRGNREIAEALIARAIEREPKNERYLESKEKMKNANATAKDVFTSVIRFSFDFDADRYKN